MTDPAPAFDGLRSLADAKKRKPGTRAVERPLHPARESKVVLEVPADETPAVTAPEAAQEPPDARPPAAAPKVAPKAAEARSASVAPAVTAVTVSLDRATEEVLEAVRSAGRFSTPRVDANRSATIRLAVARLAEQLSPDEVAAELRRRAPKTNDPGRKRL